MSATKPGCTDSSPGCGQSAGDTAVSQVADQHGGDLSAHPGIQLDFSVNLNPLGMPDAVRAALVAAAGSPPAYPDPYCRALRQGLADYHGIPAERIVCGNGASDLIYRLCDSLRPRRVLTLAPTFSEYERCARLCGAQVSRHRLDPRHDFDPDNSFPDRIDSSVDLVVCCQPNNPSGRLTDPAVVRHLLERTDQTGTILLVDECFLPFTHAPSLIAATGDHPQLVVLRALTKTHALAGVRLGYAVSGDPTLAGALAEQGPRWNVSGPAQAAGLAAVAVPGWDEATLRTVDRERGWLSAQLRDLGLAVVESQANFLLFRATAGLFIPLCEHGILIRSCANFAGLDDSYWRVGLRCHDDNARLVSILREVVHV